MPNRARGSRSPAQRIGAVAVLTTLGEDGYPHHAFLSDDEVGHPAPGLLALSILPGSRSESNLLRRRKAALLTCERGVLTTRALLRRRLPAPLRTDPSRRRFLLAVIRETSARPLPGEKGRLVSGLRYARRELEAERLRRDAAKAELSEVTA